MINMDGFTHKATSENFLGTTSVSIHYNKLDAVFMIVVINHTTDEQRMFACSKTELELICHAGKDVLDDMRG